MKQLLQKVIFLIFLMYGFGLRAQTATQVAVTGSTGTYSITNNLASVVDPGIVVTANGNISNFTVSITGSYTAGDVLAYNGTLPTGITTSGWVQATRSIQFTGTASPTVWQEFLRRVTIKTTSATCFPEQRAVSFNFGLFYYNPLNDHFYQLNTSSTSWTVARTNASNASYFGYQGYLATITSAAENSFISNFISANSWIGCSDNYSIINSVVGYTKYTDQSTAQAEGKWHWISGPETGTQMRTANGTAISGVYQNFSSGEPNNYGGSEDYGHAYANGTWNDFPNGSNIYSIVEYGGMPNDQVFSDVVFTRTVNVNGAPTTAINGGNTSVCPGGSATLTLPAFSGTVNRWEYSLDNFLTSGIAIVNSTSTLNLTNITETRYYRAIVNTTSPSCSNLPTSSTIITVSSVATGNVISQTSQICAGGLASLSLFGSQGNVLNWQVSTSSNFTTSTDIASTSINLDYTLATVGTYYFRARIQNGSCGSPVFTPSATITVVAGGAPIGGTVSGASHCGGTNSGTLTLSGHTGTIVKWQRSNDNGVVWSDISNTTTSYSYSAITQTTLFRVVLTNGSCGQVSSNPGTITVYNFNTSNNGPICAGSTLNMGVTTTGGNGPFTFAWTGPNSFTSSVQNPEVLNLQSIGAGTYSVEIGAPGCTVTQTTTVAVNAAPTITASAGANLCAAGTAAITATASTGGTLRWYNVSAGGSVIATTSSFTTPSNSATTTYYVEAFNGTCASFPRTAVVVNVNTVPTISSITPSARCGTGTVSLAASASIGTVNWYDAASSGNLVGSGATLTTPSISSTTTYYAQADNVGCLSTPRTAVIATVNQAPALSVSAQTNVSCNGGSNGSATISASGSTTPYTYSWSPSGGTAATATGLAPGAYTVTVTGANTCSSQQAVTITQPSTLSVAAAAQTNIACNSGATGAASVSTPTGGTSPYSYNWTPGNPVGDGTASVTGLTAGTWTCTVSDANGCTATSSFTLTQPSALSVSAASQTNISCFGGANGAASINTPTGGTSPYSYNWTPGNPTGDGTTSVSGLTAGTWTCTVSDANGCTATSSITVTQSPAITLTAASQTNIACNAGATGAASVATPTGGTAPYSYNWTPGNPTGDGTASVSGLTAGTWTCTVSDANGCTATRSFTVTQPAALVVSAASQTNISCFGGSTGAASVSVTGGTTAYSFNWTPGNPVGDGTASVSGLTAGTWTCTVSDANGCTATRSFTVTQPAALAVSAASQTNISCFGGANGAASINTPTGGTSPYSYNWTPGNPVGDGTASVSGLTAGTWTCTVSDANGCTATSSFTLTQPAVLAVTAAAQTNVSCFGGSNGAASVATPTGGTAPYSYNWTPGNPVGDGTASVSGLTAGTWTCTVSDANGCTATSSFTLTQPAVLAVTAAAQTNVSCFGGSNGAASVATPIGGTAPYSYNWTPGNPTGDGTASVAGLTAASWTCTVTDANGCTATRSFTITQPAALVVTPASQTNIGCNGAATGAAAINTPTGGTAPYSYNWTPGNPTGDGTTSVAGLTAGTWTVTVTDDKGCTATQSFTVTQPTALALTPASQTNISCFGGSNGAAAVNAPTGGTAPYSYNWTPGNPTGDGTASVAGLTAASWTCTVTDANGCTATRSFTITQPAALVVTPASQTNIGCNGAATGAAAINTPTGGTAPYSYNWTPGNPTGDGTTSVAGLTAGTWTVTVTDDKGCTATQSFTVTQPTALALTPASQTNISCFGGSNGAAAVNAPTGGTAPYTYNWTPGNPVGDGTASVSGLSAGTWTCTVSDANGCTATSSFTLTQPAVLAVTAAAQTNVSCFGGSNGAASVATPTGGTAPYSYNWTPGNPVGDGTVSVSGLSAGTWTCTVTDANGCTATSSFTLTQPVQLTSSVSSQVNVTCNGGVDGEAIVTGSGGTIPYQYSWSPSGGTASAATGLSAGAYTVTITDDNGCTKMQAVTITEPAVISASITATSCDSYSINSSTYTETGIYTQTLTSVNSCDSILTINLTINNSTTSSTTETACNTYSWNGQDYTESGVYTFSTTNAAGCDSTATLNLTINSSTTSSESATACDSYDWNGQSYTETGSYTFITENAAGCDSTATLNLTINSSTTSSESATACDSYDWNGQTYTETGSYTFITENAAGCDSTATLNLTINNSSTSSESATACDSFDWNGQSYTESGSYTFITENAAGCDSTATLNLTINNSSTSSESATACDSYDWNGQSYTESGSYTFITENAAGCDSTATLNLTINNSSTSSESATACDSYDWNGQSYTETGSYTFITENAAGCDSTATLNLTINNSSTSSESATACDSYDWNGQSYTESGSYTFITENAAGCDSTATLNLTINNSSTSSESATACDSYDWNGQSYTESGSYTFITENAAGCDSTATLNLTINSSSTSNESATACDSYTWNGQDYTESGSYTFTTTNAAGCDSTVTLNLIINSGSTSSEAATACDSYSWNGQDYTESGSYTFTTTNAAGCDSIATLNLTINNSSTSSETASSCASYTWNGQDYTESGVYTFLSTNVAGCDSTATLNLTINNAATSETTVSTCVSYSWNGNVYTESGVYTFETSTTAGCDSTATLNLTIADEIETILTEVACNSFDFDGNTITESGVYTAVYTSQAGCDSTVTLNLTINNSVELSESATACDTYSWNGNDYTESGAYTFVGQTTAGCDSTVTLNLTINSSYSIAEEAFACNSYTWNGTDYTETGVYVINEQTITGCDSTLTLTLTIGTSTVETITETACSSYTVNGETFTETGIYTQTLINSAGCDSTLTIDLTINSEINQTVTASACGSYDFDGTIYTESGSYIIEYTTAAGCDSILTLDLTINLSTQESITASACQSYTINAETFTETGVYTQILINAAGCDSTLTIDLTISDALATTVNAVAFQTYSANGIDYTETGTYIQNLIAVGGCDSVVTYNIIITLVAGDIDGDGVINGDEIAGDVNGDGQITDPEIAGDTNGNGVIDGDEIAGDTNGDGQITDPEIAGDTNGDGVIDGDEISGDVNGDGQITDPEIAGDTNGNGVIDGDEIAGDVNGDGQITDPEIAGDTNGNGVIDGDEIAGDTNGDGQITDPEIAGDTNGDGVIDGDEIAGDVNGDGQITDPEIAGDTNGDGVIDGDEIAGDVNGDGQITDPEIAGDVNGDGVIDGDEIAGDVNGDGQITDPEIAGDTNGDGVIGDGELDGDINGDGVLDCTDFALSGTLINTSVSVNGATITASAAGGFTYLWLDCSTMLPIAGATSQSFTPTTNGFYRAVITDVQFGCSDSSNCVSINNVGLARVDKMDFTMQPNPANEMVMLKQLPMNSVLRMIDATGRLLINERITSESKSIDLGQFASGIYLVTIEFDGKTSTRRLSVAH
jgi:hypothetical protein